ncbi:MAG: hypothetical protein KAS88_01840 [Deltaproteobacteria bacterium]|nr:hypothetical protein [Deltaproteobacteria bacterium]
MKRSIRELSIVKQSIILLIFFSSLFVFDGWLLFGLSKEGRELAHYDVLNRKLALVENNVVRLEFTLDIFVISKDFEGDMGAAIEDSVEEIDGLLDVLNDPVHDKHLGELGMHSGLVEVIENNWAKVKSGVVRLGQASSAEEELLIHNQIDSSTFFLIEGINQLMDTVELQRAEALEARAATVFVALVISFIVALLLAVIFIRRSLVPIRDFFSHSRGVVLGGGGNFRFREDMKGEAGAISRALNKVMDRSSETLLEGESIRRSADSERENVKLRLSALSALARMFGQSLSYHEISQRAIIESLGVSEAEGGAIYLLEQDGLKLSVSKGFSGTFFYKGETVDSTGRMSSPEQVVYDPIDRYPDAGFVDILKDEGVAMMVSTPIMQGETIVGFFDMMFKVKRDIPESALSFFKTMAANVGAIRAYTELFAKEHAAKAFCEKILLQMPFGVMVFDEEGLCVVSNAMSKEILTGDARSNLVGTYNLFSDDLFGTPVVLASIKRVYVGHCEEFCVEYKSGLPGQKKTVELRVRAVPLHLAGGDVGHILMTYEVASSLGDGSRQEAL